MRILGIVLCIMGLIGVRFLEEKLFYDPFLGYFQWEGAVFPAFEWGRLIISHLFRFLLNFLLSLGVVHFLFMNKVWTFQAGFLMILLFVVSLPIYLYCVYVEFGFGRLFPFYVRRILIQPLLLLIIVPIFYYRKNLKKK